MNTTLNTLESVKIYAPIFDLSERGELSRSIITHLLELGSKVTIGTDGANGSSPINLGLQCTNFEEILNKYKRYINTKLKYDKVLYLADPDYAYALSLNEKDKDNILFTYHHGSKYPKYWETFLNYFNEILVPGPLNLNKLKETNLKSSIPASILLNLPKSNKVKVNLTKLYKDFSIKKANSYIFYTIIEDDRANLGALLESYWAAFNSEAPVTLILGILGTDASVEAIQKQVLTLPKSLGPRCCADLVLVKLATPDNISALHSLGKCYVSASRCEGLNYHSLVASRDYANDTIMPNMCMEDTHPTITPTIYKYSSLLSPMSWGNNVNIYDNSQFWGNPDLCALREEMWFAFNLRQKS